MDSSDTSAFQIGVTKGFLNKDHLIEETKDTKTLKLEIKKTGTKLYIKNGQLVGSPKTIKDNNVSFGTDFVLIQIFY